MEPWEAMKQSAINGEIDFETKDIECTYTIETKSHGCLIIC